MNTEEAVGTRIRRGIGVGKGTGLTVRISHGNGVLVGIGVGVGAAILKVTYRSATIFTVANAPLCVSTPRQVTTKPGEELAANVISVPTL
jgi:hypothetical protein